MSDTHTAERSPLVTKDLAAKIARQTLVAECRWLPPSLEADEILDLYWRTRMIHGSDAPDPAAQTESRGYDETATIPTPHAGPVHVTPVRGGGVPPRLWGRSVIEPVPAPGAGASTSTGLVEIAKAAAASQRREKDVRAKLRRTRHLLKISNSLANIALAELQETLR